MFIDGMHEKGIYLEKFPFRLAENSEESFDYPSHWHNAVEIMYLVRNNFRVKVNNRDLLLSERDILFIAAGDIHGFPHNQYNGLRIFIQFDPTRLEGIGTDALKPFSAPTVLITPEEKPEFHKSLEQQILKLIEEYRNKRYAYQFSLNARIFDIMALLWQSSAGGMTGTGASTGRKLHGLSKLDKAFEYIERHYRSAISLKDISSFSGFSEYHFSRIFKDTMEKNFHDYLKEYRIKKSERLLSDSRYSITEAAYMSGFNSLATFHRAFREVKGCTPSAYRKLYIVAVSSNSSEPFSE